MNGTNRDSPYVRVEAFVRAVVAAWVALVFIIGLPAATLAGLLHHWFGWNLWGPAAILTTLISLLLGIGFARFEDRAARLATRKAEGRCPVCGYDLRATPTRCPECGTTIPFQPPEPRRSGRVWKALMLCVAWTLGRRSDWPSP